MFVKKKDWVALNEKLKEVDGQVAKNIFRIEHIKFALEQHRKDLDKLANSYSNILSKLEKAEKNLDKLHNKLGAKINVSEKAVSNEISEQDIKEKLINSIVSKVIDADSISKTYCGFKVIVRFKEKDPLYAFTYTNSYERALRKVLEFISRDNNAELCLIDDFTSISVSKTNKAAFIKMPVENRATIIYVTNKV